MRELFDEVAGKSPLDPQEAVRRATRTPPRKRFYTTAGVTEANGGLSITSGATTNSRFTLSLASLNAPNAPGDAANFSSASNYSWMIASSASSFGVR